MRLRLRYLEGRSFVPRGKAFQEAVERWKLLKSDGSAHFGHEGRAASGARSLRKSPGARIPAWSRASRRASRSARFKDLNDQKATESALKYMGAESRHAIVDIPVDRVFIGSCTQFAP